MYTLCHNRGKPVSICKRKVINFVVKTSVNYSSPVLYCVLYIFFQFIHLAGNSHWSKSNLRIQRITNNCSSSDNVEQSVFKFVVDTIFNDKSLSIETSLSITIKSTSVSSLCCFFKISLGENDERIITAQLKSTFFHVFSTLTSNFNTTNTASSKFDSPNSVV